MSIYLLVTFLAFIVHLQVAAYFFFFRPKTRVNVLFAIGCLIVAAYSLSIFFLHQQISFFKVIQVDRIAFSLIVTATVVFNFLFYYLQTGNRKLFRFILFFVVVPFAAVILVKYNLQPGDIKFFFKENGFWLFYYDKESAWSYVLLFYVVTIGLLALSMLYFLDMHAITNKAQLQIRLIMVTLLFGSIVAFAMDVLWPIRYVYVYPTPVHFLSIPFIAAMFFTLKGMKYVYFDPEALMELILKRYHCHVLFVDANGKILGANQFLLKNFGYTEKEIREMELQQLISDSKVRQALWHRVKGGHPSDNDVIEMIDQEGRPVPVLSELIRLEDNFKRFAGFILAGIDYRDIVLLKQHLAENTKNLDNKKKTRADLLVVLQKREQELHVATSRLKQEELEMAWLGVRTGKVVVEKEVLIGEMHHRVKNNMQIVTSLAALSGADPALADQDQRLFFSIRERINRIAGIHEKFYATPWLSKINFGAFLREIAMKVQSRSKLPVLPVFEVKAPNTYLTVNQAIPCGIIAEELMDNAIRHAFPSLDYHDANTNNTSVVRVAFTRRKAMCRLSVCDNGVGKDYESIKDATGSIGLAMIRILAEEHLQGSMTFNKSFGTTVEVAFVAEEK